VIVEVRTISRQEDLAALHSAWDKLRSRAQFSPFLSHEWFDAAWQWRPDHAHLHVLCCLRGNELVGALPLTRNFSSTAGVAGRTLESLTVPDTQVYDVVAAEVDRSAVALAIAEELMRQQRQWDAIVLHHLPAGAIALTDLQRALQSHGLRCDIKPGPANPLIALDSSWDTYYASRSRRLKKAMNLAINRLSKAGRVECQWLEPGQGDLAEAERRIDQAIAISARSWKKRTGNSLDHAGPQAFIRRLSQHAHRMGWLSIWTLMLNEQPIAMEYQLIDGGSVFALRSDFDAEYDSLSPGSYLGRHMLANLFGRGLRRYLMGPGENLYKYRWANDAEPVAAMTIYGRSLRGHWLAARDLALKPVARRCRDAWRRTASRDALALEASNPEDDR
jgi:CelD/BcsL family acetyltransferase involved in cellulose biosynthesis